MDVHNHSLHSHANTYYCYTLSHARVRALDHGELCIYESYHICMCVCVCTHLITEEIRRSSGKRYKNYRWAVCVVAIVILIMTQ